MPGAPGCVGCFPGAPGGGGRTPAGPGLGRAGGGGGPGCVGCFPGAPGGCGCTPAAPGLGLVGGVGWPDGGVDAPGACGSTPGTRGAPGAGGWPGCSPGAPGLGPVAGWPAGEAVAGLGCGLTSTGWNCTWLRGAFTCCAGTILLVTVGGGTTACLTGSAGRIVARLCFKVVAFTVGAGCVAICRF